MEDGEAATLSEDFRAVMMEKTAFPNLNEVVEQSPRLARRGPTLGMRAKKRSTSKRLWPKMPFSGTACPEVIERPRPRVCLLRGNAEPQPR